MSALASVQAPFSWQTAIELANHRWMKKILPVGSITYQGRTLNFTRNYLQGLADAFRERAYDYVPFQLADGDNKHTNAVDRFAGTITDLQLADDGLYAVLDPTEAGEHLLQENPQLGVSARIVEQYARADGKFYPAAVQHVLATHDPRVTGLGPWQPIEMSNSNGGEIVIDLSGSSFPGEPGPPAYASGLDQLLDGLDEQEQLDALEALYDADGDGELSGAELDALIAEAEADGYDDAAGEDFTRLTDEFDQAFTEHQAGIAAREQARQLAEIEDLTSPARSDEDRLARSLYKAAQGILTSEAQLANSRAAIQLSNSAGTCGPVDPVTGTCGARYHELTCSTGSGSVSAVQLANSGAYSAALDRVNTSPGDLYPDTTRIPARTLELGRQLNEAWGMHGDTPYLPPQAQTPGAAWDELFGPVYGSRDVYSDMAAELGRDDLAAPQPGGQFYPDVSGLRAAMGL